MFEEMLLNPQVSWRNRRSDEQDGPPDGETCGCDDGRIRRACLCVVRKRHLVFSLLEEPR